jgi:hypothetical protein
MLLDMAVRRMRGKWGAMGPRERMAPSSYTFPPSVPPECAMRSIPSWPQLFHPERKPSHGICSHLLNAVRRGKESAGYPTRSSEVDHAKKWRFENRTVDPGSECGSPVYSRRLPRGIFESSGGVKGSDLPRIHTPVHSDSKLKRQADKVENT